LDTPFGFGGDEGGNAHQQDGNDAAEIPSRNNDGNYHEDIEFYLERCLEGFFEQSFDYVEYDQGIYHAVAAGQDVSYISITEETAMDLLSRPCN